MSISASVDASIQNQWNADLTSCGRPAPDLGLPILCTLLTGSNNSTEGDDLETWSSCCPVGVNGTNIWMAQRGCSIGCYTSNVALAKNSSICVHAVGEVAGGRSTFATGECGYIDYTALKKASSQSSASRKRMGLFVVMVGLATTALAHSESYDGESGENFISQQRWMGIRRDLASLKHK